MLRGVGGVLAACVVVGAAQAQVFTDRWGTSGFDTDEANQGVALGDQDGDGRTDVFLASIFVENPIPIFPDLGGPNRLYRNGGNSFSEVGATLGLDDRGQGQGAAWGDFDNDGLIDLYVVRGLQAAVAQGHLLYRQTPSGFDSSPSSQVSVAGAGRSACWADYDNDGRLDVFVTNGLDSSGLLPDARIHLFRNDALGFVDVSAITGINDTRNGCGCAWADYDDDGDQDLYVANHGFEDPVLGLSDPQPNALYRNQLVESGSATFVDVADAAGVSGIDAGFPANTGGSASFGCAWGDFDNDGHLDLFFTNGFSGVVPFPTPNRLFHNSGDGTFTDRTLTILDPDFDESSFGVTLADFDNDGNLDAYVSNADLPGLAAATNDLLHNTGFPLHVLNNVEGPAGVGVSEFAGACASADFDGDGDLDIYSVNNSIPAVELAFPVADNLFVNGGNTNHWLHLDLVGVISNRSAVGARITVDEGLRRQMREVQAGSGYMSMDDLRVEFGLGATQVVPRVTIRWPSGCIQELENVAANQVVRVVESCAANILRETYSQPMAAMFPLPIYATAPPAGPWLDPESVLGDSRLLFYEHSDPAVVLHVRKVGPTVELDWR